MTAYPNEPGPYSPTINSILSRLGKPARFCILRWSTKEFDRAVVGDRSEGVMIGYLVGGRWVVEIVNEPKEQL